VGGLGGMEVSEAQRQGENYSISIVECGVGTSLSSAFLRVSLTPG